MVLSIIAILLSAAAFGFSLYVYIKHDRRIKPLELEIAEYHAKEIREKESAKSLAVIDACSRYVKPGNLYITITNTGQATATNVQVIILENANMFASRNTGILPYATLPPTHSFRLHYTTFEPSPNLIKIRVIWDDPSSSNKSQVFDLQAN